MFVNPMHVAELRGKKLGWGDGILFKSVPKCNLGKVNLESMLASSHWILMQLSGGTLLPGFSPFFF